MRTEVQFKHWQPFMLVYFHLVEMVKSHDWKKEYPELNAASNFTLVIYEAKWAVLLVQNIKLQGKKICSIERLNRLLKSSKKEFGRHDNQHSDT
jgi:hypothetical protein